MYNNTKPFFVNRKFHIKLFIFFTVMVERYAMKFDNLNISFNNSTFLSCYQIAI